MAPRFFPAAEVNVATVTIGFHPELNVVSAMELFRSHFGQNHEVYKTRYMGRDFVVKKSGWTGVGVKLKQDRGSTTFVFTPLMPNLLLNLLFGNLIAMLILRPGWKALERDVRTFIEDAAEFR